MKKMIMMIMIAIAALAFAFGQTKVSNDSKVEAQIIGLEKAGWEAWKNKDSSWTRECYGGIFVGQFRGRVQ
jgi:hypothetical protein